MKVHPDVFEAEARLAELKEKELRATGQAKVDLVLLVNAAAKCLDELRWAHTPRPISQESIDAAKDTDDVAPSERGDRAYDGGASS